MKVNIEKDLVCKEGNGYFAKDYEKCIVFCGIVKEIMQRNNVENLEELEKRLKR